MRSPIGKAAIIAAALIPIVGLSAGAAAAKHHKGPKAHPPQIMITASPNPVIEFGTSNIAVVIQVEANPTFANSTITISSTQLRKNCGGVEFETIQGASPLVEAFTTNGTINVVLDNDGNATILVQGANCAPGSDLFEASLNAPPFATAVTKLVLLPPRVTPPGVKGFPANEVETGDGGHPQIGNGGGDFSASDVYAVFYVETSPLFAEQTVTFSSNELVARCGLGFQIENTPDTAGPFSQMNGPFPAGPPVVTVDSTIDNDGNAAFAFSGASCAAGKSTVIVEIHNNGPTYSTQFNILPPAVTI